MASKSGMPKGSYKGGKPYIFVSYAHKNDKEVYKIINRMQQEHYRLWFDEGIDPGKEWAQNIAHRLENCEYFIAFISPEYIRSTNCQDEISFARDKEKECLLVYISETEMPSGMSMRFNRMQAIHKFEYDNDGDFYEKFFAAPGINKCLAEPGEENDMPEEEKEVPSEAPATFSGRILKNKKALIGVCSAAAAVLAAAGIAVFSGPEKKQPGQDIPVQAELVSDPGDEETDPDEIPDVPDEAVLSFAGLNIKLGQDISELKERLPENIGAQEKKISSNAYSLTYRGVERFGLVSNMIARCNSDNKIVKLTFVFKGDHLEEINGKLTGTEGDAYKVTNGSYERIAYDSGAFLHTALYSGTASTTFSECTEDESVIFEICGEAARAGNAGAQNNFGNCYYHGYGTEQDYEEAVKWYTESAMQGYALGQNNLGLCYITGSGVAQDQREAVKWLLKAAEQGCAAAQNNIGASYENGEGVEQDSAEAAKWYAKAAEQGHAAAQNNLGDCYKDGYGIEQDYAEAVKWYTRSAEQGYAIAQNNISASAIHTATASILIMRKP